MRPSLVEEVLALLSAAGVDLGAVGLAWARVMPAVAIVPAFGLRALPVVVRAALGLCLGAVIFPAMGASGATAILPWPILVLGELLRGLPIAIAAAVPLWAATMMGGLADALRGSSGDASSPIVEGRSTPLGVALSLLASAIFLATGGAARVVASLAADERNEAPVLAAAHDLAHGITIAIAVGAPLLVASVVLEVAMALIARAAAPAQVQALVAPLRSLGILMALGLVIDRVTQCLAASMR